MTEKQIINILAMFQLKDLNPTESEAIRLTTGFLKQYSNLFKGYIEAHSSK